MAGTNPIGKWLLTVFSTMLGSTWKAQIDANFSVAQRVADAFAPRAQDTPDMTVTLDAGFIVATTPTGLQSIIEVAQQTVTISAAPAAPNNRIDLIVVDGGTGVASVVAGTPAGTPSAPALPAGSRQVAQVSVPNGTTSIGPSNITDLRSVWSGNVPGVPWAIAGGSADAITASYTPAITALVDGLLLAVRFNAANATTTPNFTPNNGVIAAHTITKAGGAALVVGDIAGASAEGLLRYNLANTRWELLNPKPVPPPVTSVAGKTGAVTLAAADISGTAWTQASLTNNTQLANGRGFVPAGSSNTNFTNGAGYIVASDTFSWVSKWTGSAQGTNIALTANWGDGVYLVKHETTAFVVFWTIVTTAAGQITTAINIAGQGVGADGTLSGAPSLVADTIVDTSFPILQIWKLKKT